MTLVYAVSPWINTVGRAALLRAGKYISVGVSRSRNFIKWRAYAKKLARSYGSIVGGAGASLGAVAGLSYSAFKKASSVTKPTNMPVARKRPRYSGDQMGNVMKDRGGYTQLQYDKRRTVGRKAGYRKYLDKCLSAQLLTKIDRYQYLSPVGGTTGGYELGYYRPATPASPNSITMFPVYAFDLTMLRDNFNQGATNNYYVGNPLMRLIKLETGVAGNYNFDWISVPGAKPDGSSGTTSDFYPWQIERSPYGDVAAGTITPSPSQAPYEKCMVNWVDIRIGCWGATAKPSRVDVMICRIPDENMQPPVIYQNTVASGASVTKLFGTPADNKTLAEYNKFYSSIVDNLVGNPLNVRQQVSKNKRINVLYSKSYQFNPTETTETDAAGHQTLCKINYNIDSLFEYRQDYEVGVTGGLNDTLNDGNQNTWKIETCARENNVYPRNRKSRIFLIVKGFSNQTTADTSFLPASTPSFDLMVRRKTTII